jgi:hypothetical protein
LKNFLKWFKSIKLFRVLKKRYTQQFDIILFCHLLEKYMVSCKIKEKKNDE